MNWKNNVLPFSVKLSDNLMDTTSLLGTAQLAVLTFHFATEKKCQFDRCFWNTLHKVEPKPLLTGEFYRGYQVGKISKLKMRNIKPAVSSEINDIVVQRGTVLRAVLEFFDYTRSYDKRLPWATYMGARKKQLCWFASWPQTYLICSRAGSEATKGESPKVEEKKETPWMTNIRQRTKPARSWLKWNNCRPEMIAAAILFPTVCLLIRL